MSPEECFNHYVETGCTTYYTWIDGQRVTAYINEFDSFVSSVDEDGLEWYPDD